MLRRLAGRLGWGLLVALVLYGGLQFAAGRLDPANPGMRDGPCPAADPDDPFYLGRIVLLTVAGHPPGLGDWADLCVYQADNARIGTSGHWPREVFIGDSITQYWGMHRPAFFGPNRVNRGIAGQTSAQLLVRFTPDVLALHPRVVHILVGVNDALGKRGSARPEDYRNNIRAMLTLAREKGIAVVLGAIPPADGDGYAAVPGVAARVRELNAWLREEATRRGAVHADYWSVLAGPDGTMRRELSGDGLHPDPSAFALLEPVARNALAEAGRRAALLAPAPARAQGMVAASHFEKAR